MSAYRNLEFCRIASNHNDGIAVTRQLTPHCWRLLNNWRLIVTNPVSREQPHFRGWTACLMSQESVNDGLGLRLRNRYGHTELAL